MDTLQAIQELEEAGLPRAQAEVIVRLAAEARCADVPAWEHVDARLWQHTITIVAIFTIVVAVFRLFE